MDAEVQFDEVALQKDNSEMLKYLQNTKALKIECNPPLIFLPLILCHLLVLQMYSKDLLQLPLILVVFKLTSSFSIISSSLSAVIDADNNKSSFK